MKAVAPLTGLCFFLQVGLVWADTQPPTITATNQTSNCFGASTQVFIGPTVVDNVDPIPQTTFFRGATPATDPSGYPIGTTTVTIRAEDATGNVSTRNVNVTIIDTSAPSVQAGFDIVESCVEATGTAVTIPAPVVIDACDPAPLVVSDEPALFPLGITPVMYTAVDAFGNVSQDTLNVTVVDNVPPVVTVGPDLYIIAAGNCDAGGGPGTGTYVRLIPPTATDACSDDAAIIAVNDQTGDDSTTACISDSAGAVTVNWTVYDEGGNFQSVSNTVNMNATPSLTVNQTGNPTGYVNSDVLLQLDAVGAAAGNVTWRIGADPAPAEGTSVVQAHNATLSLNFDEGEYCPTYVSVEDGTNAIGVLDPSPCFAIDKEAPAVSFSGLLPNETIAFGVAIPVDTVAAEPTAVASLSPESGIQNVRMTILPDNRVLFDSTFTCMLNSQFGLTACNDFEQVSECTDTELCTGDVMFLGNLAPGPYQLEIVATDVAGNITTETIDFTVANLEGGIEDTIGELQATVSNPATPSSALPYITESITQLQIASVQFGADNRTLLKDNPGMVFHLVSKAVDQLDIASSLGADTSVEVNRLVGIILGEMRRYYDGVVAASHSDYNALFDSQMVYQNRNQDVAFLVDPANTGMPRAYQVEVARSLAQANALLGQAQAQERSGLRVEAAESVVDAYTALAPLYDDSVLASTYARAPYTITRTSGNVVEGYLGGPALQLGLLAAQTVEAQVARAQLNPLLPATIVNKLSLVAEALSNFASSIPEINEQLNIASSNQEVVELYLDVQTQLEELELMQESVIYTAQWRYAIGLAVAQVLNFSVYEGVSALTRGRWPGDGDPGSGTFVVAGPAMYALDGTGTPTDDIAQTAECRYSSLVYALTEGRVQEAIDTFLDSKCLLIQLYNTYYGNGVFNGGDNPIAPEDYGCDTALPIFSLEDECRCQFAASANDTTCDGIDDDCDGTPDDDYVVTTCGAAGSACAGMSTCAGGIEVPCVVGQPPVVEDLVCNNIDDDCDGFIDDDFVPTTCGVGGCRSSSSCDPGGIFTACTPGLPSGPTEQACDGLDDDCDILVDEGLDNDGDGFGCAPPGVGGTPWWDTNWSYRRRIGLDNTALADFPKQVEITIDTTSTASQSVNDFPLLVVLDGTKIDYSDTQDNGEDLRFFDENLASIPYEIEEWNEAGESFVWVRVPQLRGPANDNKVYLRYGNPTASAGQDPQSVWVGYEAVYHMNTPNDSTSSNHDGTVAGATVTSGGLASDAYLFDGANGTRIDIGSFDIVGTGGANDGITMEAFIRKASDARSDARIISKSNGSSSSNHYWSLKLNGSTRVQAYVRLNGSTRTPLSNTNVVTNNTWHHLAATYNGGSIELFRDGVSVKTESRTGTISTSSSRDVYIGNNPVSAAPFKGEIDEVRISTLARSLSYFATTNQMVQNHATIVTYAATPDVVVGNGNLNNFPVAIRLGPLNGFDYSNAEAAFADVRVIDDDNVTVLNHEIERLDSGGESILWVQVPQVDSGNLDEVWLYYGNNAVASVENPTGTWNADYETVFHFDGVNGSSNFPDATANGNDGSNVGSTAPASRVVTDLIGNGVDLNGTDDAIQFSDAALPDGTNARTMCLWATTDTVAAGIAVAASYGTNSSGQAFFIGRSGDNLFAGSLGDELVVPGFWTAGVPAHVCLTYDGTTARVYADGIEQANAPKTWNLVRGSGAVGSLPGGGSHWNGQIDEFEIFSVEVAPEWIRGSALVASTMANIGVEEDVPPPGGICERTGTSDRLCAMDAGGNWDCDDTDPASGPGQPEVCDFKDNDCDGSVDEGVLSPCGNCSPSCLSTTIGQGGAPYNPNPGNSENVATQPDGSLGLSDSEVGGGSNQTTAIVSGDTSGTLSEIDITTGRETARYCSVLKDELDENGMPRGVPNVCAACGGCNRTSRTTVNLVDATAHLFDAYISCSRAIWSNGLQSVLTMIARDEVDCIDVNNNGTIDTSSDVSGNGQIENDCDGVGGDDWTQDLNTNMIPDMQEGIFPACAEYYGSYDECILWSYKPTKFEDGTTINYNGNDLGEGVFNCRALAIDTEGDVWMGNFRDRGFFEINIGQRQADNFVKHFVRMNVSPYGAVIDQNGIIWAPNSCCGNRRIRGLNTTTDTIDLGHTLLGGLPATPLLTNTSFVFGSYMTNIEDMGNPGASYGIATDGQGRVWIGTWNNFMVAARYDPATGDWEKIFPEFAPTQDVLTNYLGTTATLSYWMKSTQTGNNNPVSARAIAGVDSFVNNNDDIFWGWLDANGRIRFRKGTNRNIENTTTGRVVTDDVWHHVTIAWDSGSGATKIFIDGTLEASGIANTGDSNGAFSDLARITDPLGGGANEFGGTLDEIRVAPQVVSDEWIVADYASQTDALFTYGLPDAFASQPGWWDPQWTRRITLGWDRSASAEVLDDFTALVVLTGTRVAYGEIQNAGEDLRFIAADNVTELPYEIEQWDESGTSIVWVSVDALTNAVGGITMYYGNTAAGVAQNPQGTWENSYVRVWHLNGSNINDSVFDTPASRRSGAFQTPGLLAGGHGFDGGNDYLRVSDDPPTPAAGAGRGRGVTVSADNLLWVTQQRSGSRLTAYDVNTLEKATVNGILQDYNLGSGPSPGTGPIGVGIATDPNGSYLVATANRSNDTVSIVNPNSGTFASVPTDGDPYTYSDFTGSVLSTFTAARGTYSEIIQPCFGLGVVEWSFLDFLTFTPGDTQVLFRVRVATTPAGLATADWYPDLDMDQNTVEYYESPTELSSIPTGGSTVAEVQVTLVQDETGNRPTANSLTLSAQCPDL